jgi:ATP-binding cassette, subfamily B, bacterial PglK
MFRKLFCLLVPKEKIHLILLFLGQVVLAFLEMAGIASIMPFMTVVTNPEVLETNRWLKKVFVYFEFHNSHSFLFFLGILVLILIVFSNLAKALMTWVTLKYDNYLNCRMAKRLLAAYLSRSYAFFLNRNTAEMGKNILMEVRTVIAGVLSAGMNILSSGLISFSILMLLMFVDPWIAINIILVLSGSYGLIYFIVRKHLSTISVEQVEANAQKYKVAGEALSGIKDLKILGREELFLEKFAVQAWRHARNNVTAGVISEVPRYALEILAFGGILMMVLIFLGKEQGSNAHIVPLLSLYAFAGYRLMPAIQQIFMGVTSIRFSLAALDVLHQDLIENQGVADPEVYLSKLRQGNPLPFKNNIEFRNVTFRYADVQEPVIKDLSLTVPIKTTVGFVGATGSGKTTTVDILLGLLSPSYGEILVDGTLIDQSNVSQWQRNLGYVPQTIFLSDDTVIRNIAFGLPDSEIDKSAVIRASRIANLDSFIETQMPRGYNTVIGDRGIRLSGGQRQRIGIARALYWDPAVLIMDEATSALDGPTEEAVMEAIRNLSRKKTIIIIAHRITTVKDCDIIYLLDNGQVMHRGTYADLSRTSDWFRAATKTHNFSTR